MKKTAFSEIPRMDFRRGRAEALTAALMREVYDLLPESDHGRLARRFYEVLFNNGACWTTEEERVRLGFESRDELGWTPSERVKYEQARIDALTAIATINLREG